MKSSGRSDVKTSSCCGQEAYCALRKVWSLNTLKAPKKIVEYAETVPDAQGNDSPSKEPFDYSAFLDDGEVVSNAPVKDTVLYLAYGLNLAASVFQGVRGIKPRNKRNVLVPKLELCLDLAGLPYNEPCFANTRLRTVEKPPWKGPWKTASRKNEWEKGLVGVVYEVTKEDYAKIIATEGPAYHDILVLCFEIPRGTNIIDPIPRTLPFPAHTLFSPSIPTEPGKPANPIGRVARPDPDYAQASARYLKAHHNWRSRTQLI